MTAAITARRPGGELEKRSLASILRDFGRMGIVDAVDVVLDVCDELANAHANGVVHGDLGLHRVRTVWPRVAGQSVDIFALGEDDSAAFTFRVSASSILVAPEQRDGRVVDARADVWAVGALLHWLIAGAPPSSNESVARTLAGSPRALIATIESCLEADPTKRVQSIDEIAQAIGSFAASPPQRFEQLVRRRSMLDSNKRVKKDPDVARVLGRLDDAALTREVTAASFAGPMPVAPAAAPPAPPAPTPIPSASKLPGRGRSSAIFAKSAPSAPSALATTTPTPKTAASYRVLADNDGGGEGATRLAAPHYEQDLNLNLAASHDELEARRDNRHVANANIATPVVAMPAVTPVTSRPRPQIRLARPTPRSSSFTKTATATTTTTTSVSGARLDDLHELEAETVAQPPLLHAPTYAPALHAAPMFSSASSSPSFGVTAPMAMPSLKATLEPAPRRGAPWTAIFVTAGAVIAIALGVGLGMSFMGNRIVAAAPIATNKASTTSTTTTTTTNAAVNATASTSGAAAVITPSSLPDAHVTTPSSLPDAPIVRQPSSFPIARSPRASAPTTTATVAPSSTAPTAPADDDAKPEAPAATPTPTPAPTSEASATALTDALH